ncbi:MAG: AAA family ATPase, partial [Bacteroides sp.]|nr:AAA family ATPase [Bacteroides sp.]
TETEVHTSDGRIDLIVKTSKFIYIIELKFGKDSQTAINQIEEKQYDLPYRNDARRVFRIGVNFNTTTRRLDQPEIQEIN